MTGLSYLWLSFVGAGLLLLDGGSLPIGPSAPYTTTVPSCLVIEETGDRPKLTSEQLDVIAGTGDGSVRKYCKDHGIDFRLLDKDNTTGMDTDWAKAAFTAAKDKSPPWMIAANARTGGSAAVTNTADALAILSRIGSK